MDDRVVLIFGANNAVWVFGEDANELVYSASRIVVEPFGSPEADEPIIVVE